MQYRIRSFSKNIERATDSDHAPTITALPPKQFTLFGQCGSVFLFAFINDFDR